MEPWTPRGADFKPLSPKASQALIHAINEAKRLGHPMVEADHLALGLLRNLDEETFAVLDWIAPDAANLPAEFRGRVEKMDRSQPAGEKVKFSTQADAIIRSAREEARADNSGQALPYHLLLGICRHAELPGGERPAPESGILRVELIRKARLQIKDEYIKSCGMMDIRAAKAMRAAVDLCVSMGAPVVRQNHLLTALLQDKNSPEWGMMESAGLDMEAVARFAKARKESSMEAELGFEKAVLGAGVIAAVNEAAAEARLAGCARMSPAFLVLGLVISAEKVPQPTQASHLLLELITKQDIRQRIGRSMSSGKGRKKPADRFAKDAAMALVMAIRLAERNMSGAVRVEHILAGILTYPDSPGYRLLIEEGGNVAGLSREVSSLIAQRKVSRVKREGLRLDETARLALDLAEVEALALGFRRISTVAILLGIAKSQWPGLKQPGGLASYERLREAVVWVYGPQEYQYIRERQSFTDLISRQTERTSKDKLIDALDRLDDEVVTAIIRALDLFEGNIGFEELDEARRKVEPDEKGLDEKGPSGAGPGEPVF